MIRNAILKSVVVFLLTFPQAAHLFSQQKVLTLENTMDIIRKFHPVARQAKLEVDLAKASLQASRGVFDPSFYLRNEKKSFDGKNYYFYSNPELKIPTWFGIDIKAGFENNTGDRLDPVTSAGRSTYAGISIPVLKGLLFDKRRAAVQQSKLLVQMSRQDQLQLIADLLYDAVDQHGISLFSFITSDKVVFSVQGKEMCFHYFFVVRNVADQGLGEWDDPLFLSFSQHLDLFVKELNVFPFQSSELRETYPREVEKLQHHPVPLPFKGGCIDLFFQNGFNGGFLQKLGKFFRGFQRL